jgi:hypothetical protein
MGIKDRKPLHSRTHQLMSPFRINFLFIHCGKAYVWNCLLCEARKLLLTEYKHSHNEILRLSHRSIVLLARILLSLFVSSFKIKKKCEARPPPSHRPSSHFPSPKIRRSLKEDFNRLPGNVGGGETRGKGRAGEQEVVQNGN